MRLDFLWSHFFLGGDCVVYQLPLFHERKKKSHEQIFSSKKKEFKIPSSLEPHQKNAEWMMRVNLHHASSPLPQHLHNIPPSWKYPNNYRPKRKINPRSRRIRDAQNREITFRNARARATKLEQKREQEHETHHEGSKEFQIGLGEKSLIIVKEKKWWSSLNYFSSSP